MAMEGLDKLNSQRDTENWRNAKGMAYFFRAFNFFFVQQEFGQVYSAQTAGVSLGIPLRLESDVTLTSKRSSVADTYKQIIADLHSALPLLPDRPIIRQRPSKQAVFALLARVYLILEDYGKALDNAQQCIDLGGRLMDYKDIDPSKTAPFPSDVEMNSEMILYTTMQASTLLRTRYSINPELLTLFTENDLRRQLYFQYNADGRVLFRGSYMGVTGTNFTGLALDEINLIKIECLLRLGKSEEAETLLKLYMSTRLRDNEMIKYPKEKDDLLAYVFMERQKQLIFRGVRWMDLRRLNSDPRFSKTLRKQIDGQVYELEPGSKRYVWPIPDDAVAYGGLEQNGR
jgi:tetratricopeptide (TPR) repeat protein